MVKQLHLRDKKSQENRKKKEKTNKENMSQ